MSQPKRSLSSPPQPDLKNRVITCLNKLSDRDTVAIATAELESIARTLSQDSFSSFIGCIHNTDSSSKSPVRKQCASLLALLSRSHGDALSPHLPRMVSAVVRRLRDPDTAVRAACVDAAAAMSAWITKPPFSAFLKPLVEALTTEQDASAQIGAALCLAAAVEAAPELEAEQLRRVLPRLGKLAKNDGFKAKAALLALIGSVVGVGGASSRSVLDWLVPCIVEFLGGEDWAVRKAAAEALAKVALAERDLAAEYKASCLASLENRRFDKVKVVRETMNRTLQLWKGVPGNDEEASAASQSSKSSLADYRSASSSSPTSKSSQDTSLRIPQTRKLVPTNRSPPPDCSLGSIAKRGRPLRSNVRNSASVNLIKLDHKKPSDCNVEVIQPQPPHSKEACEDDGRGDNTGAANYSSPETRRSLFSKTSDEKKHKGSGFRSGSRVVPFDDDESPESNVEAPMAAEELYDNDKEDEDLSLIHKQLLQIENQQFNLLELLQRFMGSSQSGINSLETRVHDIEMALDEMSHDLALSRRMPNPEFADNTCCRLPGSENLSSKFWRAEDLYSNSRFSSGCDQSLSAIHDIYGTAYSAESCKLDNKRFQHPNIESSYTSADTSTESLDKLDFYSNRMPKKTVHDAERFPFHNTRGFIRA